MEEPLQKPRKKRANKREKNLHKARNGPEKNLFVRMQESPEGRALWKIWCDRRFLAPNGKKPGRPAGAIDGYSGTEMRKKKAIAKAEAKEMVKYMEKAKGFEVPKAEFAREAIEAAVETMRLDVINVKDKLAAARLVLEFTMSKPSSSSEITVKTAESFLSDIADEMDSNKD